MGLEPLARLLTKLEMMLHRAGWDALTSAWVLHDRGDAATAASMRRLDGLPVVVEGGWVAHRMVQIPGTLVPWDALWNYAVNLAMGRNDERVISVLDTFRQPGFLGFAVATESLAYEGADRAFYEAFIRQEIDLELGMAGVVEERTIWAVDRLLRVHRVSRVKGGKPGRDMCCGIRGAHTTPLRIMVDAVLDQTPTTKQAWDARYPSLRQAALGDDPLYQEGGR